MFRKGPERAHIQMTRLSPCPPSLTYLARSLSGIIIMNSHHVIFLFCVESKFMQGRGFKWRRFLSHRDSSIPITIAAVPFIVAA
jgi:hypothetical protein